MASVPYLPRRPRPTRDPQEGGAVTWERGADDNEAYALDVSEQLPSGDTFASVTAVEVSGVTISANGGASHRFTGWIGDASGNGNPLLVTMNADKSITGLFMARLARHRKTRILREAPAYISAGNQRSGRSVKTAEHPNLARRAASLRPFTV